MCAQKSCLQSASRSNGRPDLRWRTCQSETESRMPSYFSAKTATTSLQKLPQHLLLLASEMGPRIVPRLACLVQGATKPSQNRKPDTSRLDLPQKRAALKLVVCLGSKISRHHTKARQQEDTENPGTLQEACLRAHQSINRLQPTSTDIVASKMCQNRHGNNHHDHHPDNTNNNFSQYD